MMTWRVALTTSFFGMWASAWALGAPLTTAPADPRWGDLPGTNTVFKPAVYKTLEEWKARREWLREQVRFAAGLIPEPERTPLNAEISDRREYDGYTIEKVYFESVPGLYVIGNLYRPAKITGKIPAVACALGHWEHGRLHQDDSGNYPALGGMLARLGATVLVYDMTGYNEGRRQLKHGINTPALDLWGITSLSLQTWNSVRVIDFLQSLPEVDGERIGMTGASGGGTQTFMLCAVDDRVKVACPVNMVSCSMQGGCVCENGPGLRIDTNNMEIAALTAPRPMLMISTSGDWTKRTPEVEYPFVRGIYELYGAGDNVANVHLDFPHNYNRDSREAMYRFFARWLLKRDDADSIQEGEAPKFKPEDLLVWTDATAPKDLLKFEQIAPQLEARARKRMAALAPRNAQKLEELNAVVRAGLAHMLASPFPRAEEVVLTPDQPRGPIVSVHYLRNGRRVDAGGAAVDDQPTRVLLKSIWPMPVGLPEPMPALPAGWEWLNLAAFAPRGNTGPAGDGKPRGSSEFFTTFNRTDAAESAYDVLTALAGELQPGRRERVALAAWSEMGPVCLVARAMVPTALVEKRGLRTVIDMNGCDVDSDEAYLKELNLPHIRQIGGLNAVAAVACNGPIWFHHVGKAFDEEWVEAAGKLNRVEVRVTREKATEKDVVEWLTK